MSDCIFCQIATGKIQGLRVFEDEKTLAIMDIAKDVDGHMLVIPKKHCKNILDCDRETLNAVMDTVRKVSRHLTEKCGYDGVNLLNASGESAGQSVCWVSCVCGHGTPHGSRKRKSPSSASSMKCCRG